MPENDKLSRYSSFCVVGPDELSRKTTQEGWDLVEVLDEIILEEVMKETVNPHPPPTGYAWPDRNIYSYEKPKGWSPTIEQRSWEPKKTHRFLLGKNEEKLKVDLTTLQAELDQVKRDWATTKEHVAKQQEIIAKMSKENGLLVVEKTSLNNELQPLQDTNKRQERDLNLKESQILRYEKELDELRKLVPPPTAGEHVRKVEVPKEDIPF